MRPGYQKVAKLALILLAAIIAGTIVVSSLEKDLDFTDSFYIVCITVNSLGYSDFNITRTATKMFLAFFSLLTIGVYFFGISVLAITSMST